MDNKTNSKYSPKTGVLVGKIVAFNPSKEEMQQLLGNDKLDWKIEYTGTTKEGERKVNMDIWIEDVNVPGSFYRNKFIIVDKERDSKATVGNYQWINNKGQSTWATSEEAIRKGDNYKWFATDWMRKAFFGEENLISLLNVWIVQGNKTWEKLNIQIDMENLFNGDFSELNSMVDQINGGEKPNNVMALATIYHKEDGEKSYQNLWKRVLPGWIYSKFVEGDRKGMIGKWIEEIENDQFGCKDEYNLVPLHATASTTAAPVIPPAKNYSQPKQPVEDQSDTLPF